MSRGPGTRRATPLPHPPRCRRRPGQATRAPAAREDPAAGLARQRLAVLGDAHHVSGALANPAGGQYMNNGVVAVEIEDVLTKATRDDAEIDLCLHHDPARDDVQAPGKPQQRCDLGTARADRIDDQTAQLVLDLGSHRHGSSPLGPSIIRAGVETVGWWRVPPGSVPRKRTPSNAAANLAGSCKGVPGLDTSAN